jgi:hypothetical protein
VIARVCAAATSSASQFGPRHHIVTGIARRLVSHRPPIGPLTVPTKYAAGLETQNFKLGRNDSSSAFLVLSNRRLDPER